MAPVYLQGVTKTFGSQVVLAGIDLTVGDREFLVLVGPSGCGKSTLLRAIAGLEALTDGAIYLGDRRIDRLPPKQRDVAMVFQSYALYPHMTVYDNLAFGLRRQGGRSPLWLNASDKARIDRRVREVATSLQIEKLLYRRPKQLSGGQKQRVALGRAIARDPQVFLMDEPLSNLDAQLRGDTRSYLVQLQRQLQVTTIYVTHDQIEAMTMGTRIAVLQGGKLQQVDAPLTLYRQPANAFVAGFLGTPPMNFLAAAIDEAGNARSAQLAQPIPLSLRQKRQIGTSRSLLLGMRPEHVQLAMPSAAIVRGRVRSIEALGAEANIISDLEGVPFHARVSADRTFALDEVVGWTIDPDMLYLFDRDTGVALSHPCLWEADRG